MDTPAGGTEEAGGSTGPVLVLFLEGLGVPTPAITRKNIRSSGWPFLDLMAPLAKLRRVLTRHLPGPVQMRAVDSLQVAVTVVICGPTLVTRRSKRTFSPGRKWALCLPRQIAMGLSKFGLLILPAQSASVSGVISGSPGPPATIVAM